MVDFDAAVAAVQDPNADPVFLAKIAYENPEFGANVVANPRAYPGLKRWVAQFGDERARQQLVAMGWTESCSRRPRRLLNRRNTRCQANRRNTSSRSNHRKCNIRRSTSRRQPSNASLSRLRQHLHRIWRTMLRRNTSTHIPTPQTCLKWLIFRRFSRKSQSRRMLVSPRNWP